MPGLNEPCPAARPGVIALGAHGADAIRGLNHRTRHLDAFADPSELSWLLADLASTAGGLPQLLGQLGKWLNHEHHHQRLRADNDTDPGALVAITASELTGAAGHAQHLAAALDAAHQHAAHLATA